jgi:hypothetical protein
MLERLLSATKTQKEAMAMLEFCTGMHKTCDGVTRRDFVRIGTLSLLGLTMADLFRLKAYGQAKDGHAKSVIQIWLSGGPSHLDTFDPKPEAPEDYRGPLKAIETNVSGIRISEWMPKLAKCADKYSLIRSMTHISPAHELATHIVITGNIPSGDLVFPSMGSVVAWAKGSPNELPPYIAIPDPAPWYGESGFLGAQYKPFSVRSDPNNPNFKVQGLTPPSGVTTERITNRRNLLQALDNLARRVEASGLFDAVDSFYQRAFSLLLGDAKKAFDLSQEPDEVRDRYGRHTFGQSCLLARRLVEAGVPFVTVHFGGWDTHFKNFDELSKLVPILDQGLSALLEDLAQRGLLKETIVVCVGEFGRTPKIDWSSQWQGGRHHWNHVFSALVAGGGFEGGQVVGESDEKGEFVKNRPVYPWDLAASIYTLLGIDYNQRLPNPQGRVTYITPHRLGVESGGLLKEIMPAIK